MLFVLVVDVVVVVVIAVADAVVAVGVGVAHAVATRSARTQLLAAQGLFWCGRHRWRACFARNECRSCRPAFPPSPMLPAGL